MFSCIRQIKKIGSIGLSTANANSMHLVFHVGSREGMYEVNTIIFFGIPDVRILNKIEEVTRRSGFLFNAITTESDIECGYRLTIYLPDDDELHQPYGNFEKLFDHDKYKLWKAVVLAEFPNLSESFERLEIHAKGEQKQYRLKRSISQLEKLLKMGSIRLCDNSIFDTAPDFKHAQIEKVIKLKKEYNLLKEELCPEVQHRHLFN